MAGGQGHHEPRKRRSQDGSSNRREVLQFWPGCRSARRVGSADDQEADQGNGMPATTMAVTGSEPQRLR